MCFDFYTRKSELCVIAFLLGHGSSLHLCKAVNRRHMDIERPRDIGDRFAF
jgi:transposase